MKQRIKQIRILIMCVSALLIVTNTEQANAGPSYTASLSFFEGFDLETGMVDEGIQKLIDQGTESSDIIRLVFVAKEVEPKQTTYEFKPEVDFQLGYNVEQGFFGLLPNDLVSVSILKNQSFESVVAPNIFSLDLMYDPVEIQFDSDYTLIVWTKDDHFFKLGNFSLSGSIVSFDYALFEPDTKPIPEPSMLILLGIGVLGISVVARKKGVSLRKSMLFLLFAVTVFTYATEAYAMKKSRTGFVYPVNADYIPVAQGGYIGWLDVNVGLRDLGSPPYHLAVDFKVGTGTPVYAIADGTIAEARHQYVANANQGGVLIIRHKTSDGTDFTATYGHIALAKTQGDVKAGDLIGTITDCWVRYQDGRVLNHPHLHFSIRPGSGIEWTAYTSNPSVKYGFENPLEFLENRFPRNLIDWKENNLGGVDLDAYCKQRGYAGVHLGNPSDPGSWSCKTTTCGWTGYDNSSSGVSVNYACREQYPQYSNVWAEAQDWGNAYSWKCYTDQFSWADLKWWKREIGGVNFRQFCQKERWNGVGIENRWIPQATRYASVTRRDNDAGSWRCTGKSVHTCTSNQTGISVNQACREQKNNSAAYSRATNSQSAYSWQCFVKVPVYSTSFALASASETMTRYLVNVSKAGTGGGTITAQDINCGADCQGGEYDIGSFVDLKAIPDAASDFAGWLINGSSAKGAIPIDSNPIVTAVFNKKPPTRPTITGFSPNPVPRKLDWSRQWVTIYGSNFQPGAKLLFKIPGTEFVYPDRESTYISSTQLRYYISVGPNIYDWTVEVINPDGQRSNAYGFQVR